MSFGWAVCSRDGETSLPLVRAADERLHAQKLIRSHLASGEVVALPPHSRAAPAPLARRLIAARV